jgi:arylsulfatase A-like enzyme
MMLQPNFIFILVDDLGRQDLGVYGSTFYETPNLDNFAKESMLFTNAYAACPVCSPTRASLMTGQYPARIGVTNWIGTQGEEGCHPNKGRMIDAPYIDHLPLELNNLPTILGQCGYQTWHIGKWHLGDEPYYPEKQGFSVNIGGCHFGHPPYGYFSPYHLPTLVDGPDGEYLTDRLTNEAIDLIEKRDPEKPFFLNLSYYSVHNPIEAPQEDIQYFKDKAKRLGLDAVNPFIQGENFPTNHKHHLKILRRVIQSNPSYAAMVFALDRNIGKLLAHLEQPGLIDNTVVVFYSDNGGLATSEGSPTSNLPLSEGKGWMYEGGTREPLLIRWPGHISPKSTCDIPVITPDFYPTLIELAGGRLPEEQICDGKSLVPLLLGETELDRDAIFWHYPHYGNQGGSPSAAIRMRQYKLIHFFGENKEELYNLENDIGEENDLVDQAPEIRQQLSHRLLDWIDGINAIIPEPNPQYAGCITPKKRRIKNRISKYDLETPVGILLHDMEAKGILDDYIDYANRHHQWVINSSVDHTIDQLEFFFGNQLQEIKQRLRNLK